MLFKYEQGRKQLNLMDAIVKVEGEKFVTDLFPAGIYLLKVSNKSTGTWCEIR